MLSTDFIFRQQKILLTTRIVVLKSGYYATKYYSCPGQSCFSARCLQTKLILPNALPVMYLDKKSETVFAAQMACIVLVGRQASYNWLKSKLDQIPQLANYYCVNFHSTIPTVMFGQFFQKCAVIVRLMSELRSGSINLALLKLSIMPKPLAPHLK